MMGPSAGAGLSGMMGSTPGLSEWAGPLMLGTMMGATIAGSFGKKKKGQGGGDPMSGMLPMMMMMQMMGGQGSGTMRGTPDVFSPSSKSSAQRPMQPAPQAPTDPYAGVPQMGSGPMRMSY